MSRLSDAAAALDAFEAELNAQAEVDLAELLAPEPRRPFHRTIAQIPACPAECDCPDCQCEEAYWADAHFEHLAGMAEPGRAT